MSAQTVDSAQAQWCYYARLRSAVLPRRCLQYGLLEREEAEEMLLELKKKGTTIKWVLKEGVHTIPAMPQWDAKLQMIFQPILVN